MARRRGWCCKKTKQWRNFVLTPPRAVQGQIEFTSHAGVGRVGEGVFAVGGVLELAAARGQGGQVFGG
jgi:hypothetical protein